MKQAVIGFLVGIFTVPVVGIFTFWGYSQVSPAYDETEFRDYYNHGQYAARMHSELPVGGPFLGENAFLIETTPLTLFERKPVLTIAPNFVAHVCFSTANNVASRFVPALGLGFRFNEQDQKTLLAALENTDYPSMEFEVGGDRLVRFWKTPDGLEVYAKKLKENPTGLDLEIFAEKEEVLQLLRIAHSYSYGEPPATCDESVDLNRIPYWSRLMNEVWPNQNQG